MEHAKSGPERKQPVEPAEPVERDDVRVSVNRCPCCHEDVVVDADRAQPVWLLEGPR